MFLKHDWYNHSEPETKEDTNDTWIRCMSRAMKYSGRPRLDPEHAAELDAEIVEDNSNHSINITRNIFPTIPPATRPVNQTKPKKSAHFEVKCQLSLASTTFVEYYFVLLFLLCFATPVLITTSLNVFIHSAVQNTTYEVIISRFYLYGGLSPLGTVTTYKKQIQGCCLHIFCGVS